MHDAGDVVLALAERGLDLRRATRASACCTRSISAASTGKRSFGFAHARPVELREVLVLPRVGGVGQRQRVARAAVERLAEVEDLVALLLAEPLRKLRRTFQSKAALSAFSTPSVPPATKKACGR